MQQVHDETQFTLGDVFTDDEIKRAADIYAKAAPGTFCTQVVENVVTPEVLARIKREKNLDFNARYLGYAIEYVFNEASR